MADPKKQPAKRTVLAMPPPPPMVVVMPTPPPSPMPRVGDPARPLEPRDVLMSDLSTPPSFGGATAAGSGADPYIHPEDPVVVDYLDNPNPAAVLRTPSLHERVSETLRNAREYTAHNTLAGWLGDKLGLTQLQQLANDAADPYAAHHFSQDRGEYEPVASVPPPVGPLPKNAGLSEIVERLFPKLDAYGKPAAFISGKTIVKRAAAAADLSPGAQNALGELATQLGERRVSPAELQALARGETYTPDRVLRKVAPIKEGKKQIPGAPLGVSTARQERALREDYIRGMEEGVQGKDWYKDSGEAILFHANDDPARALRLASDLSATSSTTNVSGNTLFGIKGYNLGTARALAPDPENVPIITGRFPTAMGKRIEGIHASEAVPLEGLKQDAFTHSLARGGNFLPEGAPDRPTNDIWQGERWKFVNPDGTPMRQGFTPAQHDWMDRQTAKAVDTANQRATAGITDWNKDQAQAANWTTGKVEAGQVSPEDAAKSFADYFPEHYAQGSREFTPGKSTGHMPELLEPENERLRQLYHDLNMDYSGIYDPQMRDQITAGYGGLVGPSFEGPGWYKGRPSPGVQTQVLTGSSDALSGLPDERIVDPGSTRIMDAAEATHGLVNFQDAWAWNKLLPAGSGGERTGWDVLLPNGTIDPKQLQTLMQSLPEFMRKRLIPVPIPGGIRLAFRGAPDPTGQQAFKFFQDMGPTLKDAVKNIGGRVEEGGAFRGGYGENPWDEALVGQQFFDPIRKMGTDTFDEIVPDIMARRRVIDRVFAKDVGGRVTLNPLMDEIRGAVANEGWAGLQRLAKKYAITTTALLAAVGIEVGAPPPAPPASVPEGEA